MPPGAIAVLSPVGHRDEERCAIRQDRVNAARRVVHAAADLVQPWAVACVAPRGGRNPADRVLLALADAASCLRKRQKQEQPHQNREDTLSTQLNQAM